MKEIIALFGIFYLVFLLIALVIYLISPEWLVQEYPKEWEEEEEIELHKKFDEHKKSQE